MRNRFLEKLADILWDVTDRMMEHEILVQVVSSIIGSLLGVWLTWFILMPLIVRR